MQVLIAAPEVAPIIEVSDVGRVVGSLSRSLEKIKVDADVIVPFFPNAKIKGLKIYKSRVLDVAFDGDIFQVEVHKTKLPNSNVDVFLLKNSRYFNGNRSEFEVFSFFDRCVVDFIKSGFNTYALVHCNDWQTGLVTHILSDEMGLARPATIFTIHNLSHQGGDVEVIRELGITPGQHPLIDWDSSDGDVNFLLQGITSTDFVSTVSPSYAKEMLYKDVGGRLSEVLYDIQGKLIGILNGVDYGLYPRDFDKDNWKIKKQGFKKSLQKKLNLRQEKNSPIFAYVSKFDSKLGGLDILYGVVSFIVKSGGQFVLLGEGDKNWAGKFEKLKEDSLLKDNIYINLDTDFNLATKIYRGADYILLPAKLEPCGVSQMVAMWFGVLPVAHAVGGLRDAILNGENGFLFNVHDTKDFQKKIKSAIEAYGTKMYDKMVETALTTNYDWKRSALKYKELYEKVIQIRKHKVELEKDK